MTQQDLTITLRVEASPVDVVAAISDVPSWWSGTIEGPVEYVRHLMAGKNNLSELIEVTVPLGGGRWLLRVRGGAQQQRCAHP